MERNFCHFRIFFCPFTPLTTWKIKHLKKWKNTWSYYHFTHVDQTWQPYKVWFLRYGADGHNFLSFWTIFCPFTPLTTQKIKILKKGKKPWRCYHFTHAFDKWQKFLSFWTLFQPLTPLTSWKIKILKKWKQKTTKQTKTAREITMRTIH